MTQPPAAQKSAAELLRDRKQSRVLAFGAAFLMTLLFAPCMVAWVSVLAFKKYVPPGADPDSGVANTLPAAPATWSDWVCSPLGFILLWSLFLLVTTWANPRSKFSRGVSMFVSLCGGGLYFVSIFAAAEGDEAFNFGRAFLIGMTGVAAGALYLLWKLGRLQKVETQLEAETPAAAVAAEAADEAEEDLDETTPGWDEAGPPPQQPQ